VIETDALVVGAGPIGLFQVFELGLQGIAAHVVDVLDAPGGQCMELYPDKPIYDIPGVPRCTGLELTQNLLNQIEPFKPSFHFGQQVESVERQSDGRWLVQTLTKQQNDQTFLTRTLFIAAGVGAFVPKELKIDGLARFTGTQLHYRLKSLDQPGGQRVVVVGGEEAAVDSAIALASHGMQPPNTVSLVHRRDVLQASPESLEQIAMLRAQGRIEFIAGQVTAMEVMGDRLATVVVTTPDNTKCVVALDALLVCQGISPRLGPIANWSLAMERKQLCVDTATFATSEAGIYAVGDINTYPGKRKLILCGFHEATLAAFAAAKLLHPEDSGVLQYTTSSALLQQRLSVLTNDTQG